MDKHPKDIIRAHLASGSMTCEEVERATGLSHQTVSARISEMARAGEITATDERRVTSSGRTARVYQLGSDAMAASKNTKKAERKPAAKKKDLERASRPTVTKKCKRCSKKRPHGTFFIKSLGKSRTAPWCRDCDCERRTKARKKAKRALARTGA
jgi:predicted transcriptional regulator